MLQDPELAETLLPLNLRGPTSTMKIGGVVPDTYKTLNS